MASSLFSKLSFSPSNTSLIDDVESLSCPICLEVYSKPKRIPCGHVFCKECLNNYDDVLEPACPICRQLFTVSSSKKASDIEKCISISSTLCRGCSNKIPLAKYRHHNFSCAGLDAINKETVRKTSQKVNEAEASKTVNRQTFRCPYCGLQNLDTHGLVKHCNSEHNNHPGRVVCPICASMPWGNKHQRSSDFIHHLNLRHQFEYDFVVDFSLDDEAMLEKAIKASLEEQ
ncbi:hypothetical protein CHUAL_007751 [Chamberlinius hualienensis]